jgi:hypothetical protein
MIAGLQPRHEDGADRRHAAGGGAGNRRTFHRRHALLQHGNGGIADAAILVTGAFPLEAGFAFLGILIGIAGGQEQRLAGFLEGRAYLSTAYGQGAWTPIACFLVGGHELARKKGAFVALAGGAVKRLA